MICAKWVDGWGPGIHPILGGHLKCTLGIFRLYNSQCCITVICSALPSPSSTCVFAERQLPAANVRQHRNTPRVFHLASPFAFFIPHRRTPKGSHASHVCSIVHMLLFHILCTFISIGWFILRRSPHSFRVFFSPSQSFSCWLFHWYFHKIFRRAKLW